MQQVEDPNRTRSIFTPTRIGECDDVQSFKDETRWIGSQSYNHFSVRLMRLCLLNASAHLLTSPSVFTVCLHCCYGLLVFAFAAFKILSISRMRATTCATVYPSFAASSRTNADSRSVSDRPNAFSTSARNSSASK